MGLGFWDGVVWVEIVLEGGFMLSVPIGEFEVISGFVSRFWSLKVSGDGTVRLWPPSFYSRAYHSNLADRVPDVVADFERVRAAVEKEDVAAPLRLE